MRRLDDESVVRAPLPAAPWRPSGSARRIPHAAHMPAQPLGPRPQTPCCSLLDLCRRRVLYYSSAGGYEQALVASESPHWLGAFTSQPIVRGAPSAAPLAGSNTLVQLGTHALLGWLPILAALEESGGTRVTVMCHREGQRRGRSRRVQAFVSCRLPRARAARCRARGVGGQRRRLACVGTFLEIHILWSDCVRMCSS